MNLGQLLQHGHSHPDTEGLTIADARGYELCGAVCFGGLRPRAYSRLARLSGARPGDRVLDVGCGTGYLTRRMAKAVGPGGSVLGVDPSAEVVEYARDKTREAHCTYETGVGEALRAADGSFDVVVTALAVHHLPEDVRPVALREMYRVLRPGGRLLVADFRPPRTRAVRHLVGATVGHVMADYRVDLLDGLVADAGFEVRGHGDVRPWLRYVQGVRPEKP
ncbi:class I SAM-dependent methyltransferase [Streptomyces cylindrosporus]|uniref:Methyltransferase domain-containing protein n=1 Tax=Streptomyces cylindrosporus TaxID=2927583 RepID=A0ABS9Y025_9ACTN|nr:methyltransferase domain-containing protein [Streptomyces cylindrosporus]MCI3270562.1 methyltransferase domain-containing protein [Streptomyces cylindrosporus]